MILGRFQPQIGEYQAFIPADFPPQDLHFSDRIFHKAHEAALALGRLDGLTQFMPDAEHFLFSFLQKEAEASIEIDLDADEISISAYISALSEGLKKHPDINLIRELHRRIYHENSGEFRDNQNWIGGNRPQNALFVPPPSNEIERAMQDLENFFADKNYLSLLKIALIHAQFETIHPFSQCNGRTGRALISVFLQQEKLLQRPFLFLSNFFKKHRKDYFEKLENYHFGEVEEWFEFFLETICESAQDATLRLTKIYQLREKDLKKISELGKTESESAQKILPQLFQTPIVNVARIQEITGFTRAGAQKVIDRFITLEILAPKDESQKYGREFFYQNYVEIFKN